MKVVDHTVLSQMELYLLSPSFHGYMDWKFFYIVKSANVRYHTVIMGRS